MGALQMTRSRIPAFELRVLIDLFPLMEARVAEAARTVREAGDRMAHSVELGPTWAHLYDLPHREHMARAAVAFEIDREVVAASQRAFPMSAFRDFVAEAEESGVDAHGTDKTESVRLAWLAFGASHSLYSSMRSVMIFGLHINELLASARELNDDRALLNAVRIDPSVICSRTGSVRLSRACLERDAKFLTAVRRAMAGKLTKRQDANFRKMRLIVRTLSDCGAGRLPDDRLAKLFNRELKRYPSISSHGDVARNLRKSVEQQMKRAATAKH